MVGEVLRLEIEDRLIVGELALELPPGTSAAVRDRAIDKLMGARLIEVATERGAVLSAAASRFAFQQPGKDDRGRTRFLVGGRVEGDRLLPAKPK